MFNGIVQPNGTAPIHLVNGAGGNREGNENPRGDAPWSAPGAHTGAFAYGIATFVASPSAGASTFDYVVYESATGAVLDQVRLTK